MLGLARSPGMASRLSLSSTAGVPNQSIAIYRSIFKCLAVDRGWF